MKLLAGVLTIVALTGPASTTPNTAEDKYLETIPVSENVYVFKPKIDWVHGNGVAIIGPDGVFFIDTYIQFNYAEEAIRRLKRITSLPVTYVLNTHSHDDHTTGNGVFRRVFPASRLIVHELAVEGLEHRVKAKVEGEAKFIARPVEHDLSYLRLLERAFSSYQDAATAAIAAKVPIRQAMDSISFPDIDRAFTGDDAMKQFTYRSFFTRNVFVRAYRDAAPPPVPTEGSATASVAAAAELRPAASDSEEIALGAALVAQFDIDRGVAPTPQSQRIEAYLQSIADSLGRHTNRKLPWKIHYDPHAGIKSGFALPGGHIVIWGGALAYMSTEDEAAAIIAHEIEHTDVGQVAKRLDSLRVAGHRSLGTPSQWKWQEFGVTYGEVPEKLCDYEGAKLMVKAGYSPIGFKTLLESFVALAKVHAPNAPPPRVIVDRVSQIDKEIMDEHWEGLTKTRALKIPN